MTDRRYDDDEVAAIFQKAAENPQGHSLQAPHSDGMTLAELQEIGREAGIAPEAVARAAQSLAIRVPSDVRTFLGMPLEVGRTIELGRRLTDAEWEQLVGELRVVFKARGKVSSGGSLRQWTNGNLQALLEPTPAGQRLRLSTVKGDVRGWTMLGAIALTGSGVVAVAAATAGHLGASIPGVVMLALVGAGAIANGAIR
ncbi:MAG: chalcone isomerase domain-containing protein, partial [Gemmatimonadota bacterium]|nr:chalcone isomerase domain-containing protein [Gemmatimonadota bacterium]